MSGTFNDPTGQYFANRVLTNKAEEQRQAAATDYQGIFDTLSPELQAAIEAQAKTYGMSIDQYMPFLMQSSSSPTLPHGLGPSGYHGAMQPGLDLETVKANLSPNASTTGYGTMGAQTGFTGPNGQTPDSGLSNATNPNPPSTGEGQTGHEASLAENANGGPPPPANIGLTGPNGQPPATTPAATTPAASAAPTNAPDTGFSSRFQPADFEALANDPNELFRQWAMSQGLDPDSTSPLMQARKRAAARARGVYELLNGGDNNALGPAADTQKFLDFFKDYMTNGTTAGAAPLLTIQQAQQALSKALQSAATNPDDVGNLWSNLLMNSGGTDLTTGQDFMPEMQDQVAALQNLLLSALGGAVDPSVLTGLTRRIERQGADYQSSQFAGKTPVDARFLAWLAQNGGLTGAGQ